MPGVSEGRGRSRCGDYVDARGRREPVLVEGAGSVELAVANDDAAGIQYLAFVFVDDLVGGEESGRPPEPRGVPMHGGVAEDTRVDALSLAQRSAQLTAYHRLPEEGDSSPSSRARSTASVRLCTLSLAYTWRRWALIVLWETNSSAAISGPRRLVGR